jgi:hypothetical protein
VTYGRSILDDIRLAEEAGMVFPVAEVEVASEDEEGDGLEKLTVPELRERGRVLGVGSVWAQTVISLLPARYSRLRYP